MTVYGYTLAQVKKSIIAAVGFALMVLTAAVPVLPASYLPFTLGAIGFLTTLGVFLARNADTAPPPAP